jgi:hypothetical protein
VHLCIEPINPAKDEKDITGWNAFGRVMGAPGDRNLVDFYIDGGIDYKRRSGAPMTHRSRLWLCADQQCDATI